MQRILFFIWFVASFLLQPNHIQSSTIDQHTTTQMCGAMQVLIEGYSVTFNLESTNHPEVSIFSKDDVQTASPFVVSNPPAAITVQPYSGGGQNFVQLKFRWTGAGPFAMQARYALDASGPRTAKFVTNVGGNMTDCFVTVPGNSNFLEQVQKSLPKSQTATQTKNICGGVQARFEGYHVTLTLGNTGNNGPVSLYTPETAGVGPAVITQENIMKPYNGFVHYQTNNYMVAELVFIPTGPRDVKLVIQDRAGPLRDCVIRIPAASSYQIWLAGVLKEA